MATDYIFSAAGDLLYDTGFLTCVVNAMVGIESSAIKIIYSPHPPSFMVDPPVGPLFYISCFFFVNFVLRMFVKKISSVLIFISDRKWIIK